MSIKALQDYTFVSKYARYLPEKKRRETWNEAVERVRDMHLRRYPQIKKEITWAFDQVKAKRVLGSQRALQFGGPPVEKKNARIYNCCSSYCDRVRFFQECFWLLLCGCGTGFSVQKHHAAKLPDFCLDWQEILDNRPKKVYAVPDSIEGWADALGVLMSSFLGGGDFPEYEGYWVEFDYSLVRPEGAPLGSSSGKAPGPKPLQNAIEKIRALLLRCLDDGQTQMRPIDAYDIVMHASDAVLSGGVRRSATICLFSPDDIEMAQAKTGNWFIENPQRGRSNNSALLVRGETTKKQFQELMTYVREFGEPGFVWSDSTELLVNPCVEISFCAYDLESKKSGWHFCNLCEINGKFCNTEEKFSMAARAAAIIGTCQAGYTDFDYLGEITKKIVEREALLGVSITGMMDNSDILFDPKLQRKMAKLILKVNEDIAKKIGINPTARATCVKPSGTTSCILGTSSGIHPHHAERYIRRSQANHLEPPLNHLKSINPHAVEKSVWSANGTDDIISFCVNISDPNMDSERTVKEFRPKLKTKSNDLVVDLSGKRFTRWQVTEKTRQTKGKRYWYCLCDCGEEKWVWHGNLQNGTSKSCGCLKKRTGIDSPHWKGHGQISAKKWRHIQSHAATRKISFEISIEQAWKKFVDQNGQCALTGLKIKVGKTASLDRVNSSKGYTRDNIQWVHKMVNKMKMNIPQNEFIHFCDLVSMNKNDPSDFTSPKTKSNISGIELLKHVKLTQQNWVMSGTVKSRCAADYLVHNVSNTISVKPEEWDSVTDFIYDNRKWFAGVSLLPITGDKDYQQAPFTAIYTPFELVKMYGDASVMASGLIVDGLHAFANNLWKACDAALGQGEPLVEPEPPTGDVIKLDDSKKYETDFKAFSLKKDWARRALQFSERYFDSDIRLMTYCLKDVNNWKYWCDLNREYQEVDYTEMVEEQDNTKIQDTIACAGGACDLNYV